MKKLTEGHVVEDFYIGKTHVQICDDYCRGKTRAEVDEILARIARYAQMALAAAAEQKASSGM